MNRTEIINYLIMRFQYKRYLEIGVGVGNNFNKIEVPIRHSVDPYYPATFGVGSNKFFRDLPEEEKYDIIFIDGNHTGKAVMRDIQNALKHLSEDGIILVHDCNPPTHKVAKKKPKEGWVTWYGDGYRNIIKLRATEPNLFVRVIDTDCGIAIIKPTNKKQNTIKIPEKFGYGFMSGDREYSLGLISVQDFLKLDLNGDDNGQKRAV